MKFTAAVNDEADRLLSQGYRVTSRKHRHVAKIDCNPTTYVQRMRDTVADDAYEDYHTSRWYDYYRRVITADRRTVSKAVVHCMATKSCWDVCSFAQAFPGQEELVR